MKRTQAALIAILILLGALVVPASAEKISCAECGMAVDSNSKFAAKLTQGDALLSFCDIGDMLNYVQRKKPTNAKMEVRDFPTGDWIDAQTAFYVRAEKKFRTPMGWSMAAFRDKNRASEYGTVLDFDAAPKALK